MKKRSWIIIIILFQINISFSQHRNNIWMLGGFGPNNMGLNFSSGLADTFSLFRQMEFFITNGSICDTSGQLLFYTNGNYVANRNHDYMQNTTGFNPGYENNNTYPYGSGIEQGALIIPKPGSDNQYYVFHESAELFSAHSQVWELPLNLSYSVVDMTLDAGLGGITSEKNIHAINDTLPLGRITACKHANGRDWWIIVHQYWTDFYYKLLLTPSGISGPYMQQIGFVHDKYDPDGQAIFSPDGTKYVYLSYDTTMDIMDFDRCSGDFSNVINITVPDSDLATMGCTFSPSGQFLYVSNNLHVFQYDTWAADIPATKTVVATYDGFVSGLHATFYMMQLAPDNKIYISTWEGTDVLHVINDPDQPGLACSLVQHQLQLPSYNAQGLPNAPNYDLGPISGSVCDSLSIGINEMSVIENSIEIFPNPFYDKIFFHPLISSIENISVTVFNNVGEKVFEGKTLMRDQDINLDKLTQGVYFFNMKNEKFSATKKIVKLHQSK
jgi:hypothetical protein